MKSQKLYHVLIKTCILIVLYIPLFYSTNHLRNAGISETDSTVVEKYGQLRVQGTQIVDKDGKPVTLRGMSLFWSQWIGKYYNYDCIQWLRDDWECTVVRASMGIEPDGYLTNPIAEKNKVLAVIDACIDLGIYVIVDWHDHNAQNHQQQAKEFFAEIAKQYGDYPNLIYEIFNEPLQVSWANVIKPYAEAVIDTIRFIDPDNIIIVGTPTWSQDVDIASQSPLQYENIAYALHFYAATHKQFLRNKAITALNNGIALWVSEFGTSESSGNGTLDSTETDIWMNFMESRKISWCNWSVADKNETSAALKSGASQYGNWSDADLTRSGSIIRGKIKSFNDPTSTDNLQVDFPLNFKLYQNYPNPFNPQTTIEYELEGNGFVKLEIFDIKGSKIRTLIDDYQPKGLHKVLWDGNTDENVDASSGIYFYHLFFIKTDQSSEFQNEYKPMVLLK